MTDDRSDLEARAVALRRVVYGTPDGYASAAADELVEVEAALSREPKPVAGAVEWFEPEAPAERGAPQESEEPGVDAPADDEASARPADARRRRRRVLVGVGAAVVVVALASVPLRDLVDPPKGLEIFEQPQSEDDTGLLGYATALGMRSDTLRTLGSAVGYEAWTFRDGEDVCLIVQRDSRSGWGAGCVERSEFEARGIRQLITYDELSGSARPAGLTPGESIELRFGPDSTGIEWTVIEPEQTAAGASRRVWVPPFEFGGAPLTYEEWWSRTTWSRSAEFTDHWP
ncbi:hypothetical protein ET445_01595 [Agromyces protaetiae]|uniref:Uncharacterized protein n=1 Tax=Agromyces protaetiae TaxID=2509455 RepID=A0A4P6F9J0_9MICO|nr:hypothetical protein [Agromyces protaetiae]QAY72226.1 hypothetical protein ET445_01595 [Agromyces protaetiae]